MATEIDIKSICSDIYNIKRSSTKDTWCEFEHNYSKLSQDLHMQLKFNHDNHILKANSIYE